MSETPVQPVADDELLARFIRFRSWIRHNQTVKQDAFIPPRDLQLSVTRHLNLSEEELWNIGQRVANQVANSAVAPLYGRADLPVRVVCSQRLRTEAAPLVHDLNHAHIIGWPIEKPAQKIIALELAAKAAFRSR